jgi:uncharacterized protein DUF5985
MTDTTGIPDDVLQFLNERMRAYFRVRQKLLLWSGLCFAGLAASNVLLFVDLELVEPDLYLWRLATAALAMSVLLYGLIWEGE